MKKYIAVLMSLLMLIIPLSSVDAYKYRAEDSHVIMSSSDVEAENDRIIYDLISDNWIDLLSPSSGKIKVLVSIDAEETMEKIGFSSLELQQSSGVNWVTQSTVTNQFEFNTDSFDYDKTFSNLSSGYHYRVKITLYARRAPGEVQTITKTSDSIICH